MAGRYCRRIYPYSIVIAAAGIQDVAAKLYFRNCNADLFIDFAFYGILRHLQASLSFSPLHQVDAISPCHKYAELIIHDGREIERILHPLSLV